MSTKQDQFLWDKWNNDVSTARGRVEGLCETIKSLEKNTITRKNELKEAEAKLATLLKMQSYLAVSKKGTTHKAEQLQIPLVDLDTQKIDLIKSCLNKRRYTPIEIILQKLKGKISSKFLDDFTSRCAAGQVPGVKYHRGNENYSPALKLPKATYKQPSRRNKYLSFARNYLRKIGATSATTAISRGNLYKEIRKQNPDWADPHHSAGARLHEVIEGKVKTKVFKQEKRGGRMYVWVMP